jgi:hypothetical protein
VGETSRRRPEKSAANRGPEQTNPGAGHPAVRSPRTPPSKGLLAGANEAGLLTRGSVSMPSHPARGRTVALVETLRGVVETLRTSYSGGAVPDSHRLPIDAPFARSIVSVTLAHVRRLATVQLKRSGPLVRPDLIAGCDRCPIRSYSCACSPSSFR